MSSSRQTEVTKFAIQKAKAAKTARDRQQGKLIADEDIHHQQILDKLWGRLETVQVLNFERCGREVIYRTCRGCSAVEPMPYRCDLKWCPRCQWRIAKRRAEVLDQWASRIHQPKHLVLTQRNFPIITGSKLLKHTRALSKLRRRAVWEGVRGGCVTVEVTNEGNGWHLHSHWLIDVRWMDMSDISSQWGSLVGQEFGICKIKDLRDRDYLREVSKYVVKSSEMVKWPSEQVVEFVTAIRGRRFFFSFGDLSLRGPEIRRTLNESKRPQKGCDCGCQDFIFQTDTRAVELECRKK